MHGVTSKRTSPLFLRMVCGSILGLRQVLVSMRRSHQRWLLSHLRKREVRERRKRERERAEVPLLFVKLLSMGDEQCKTHTAVVVKPVRIV